MPSIQKRNKPREGQSTGFTLIELMVTLAILVILIGVAAPSFTSIVANQRARSVASELYATLMFARGTAIARNTNVTVLPKGTGWQNGWQVQDVNNAILDDRGTAPGISISSAPSSVVFTPSGRLPAGVSPAFVLVPIAGGTTQCISVSLSGRPYMKAASSC